MNNWDEENIYRTVETEVIYSIKEITPFGSLWLLNNFARGFPTL